MQSTSTQARPSFQNSHLGSGRDRRRQTLRAGLLSLACAPILTWAADGLQAPDAAAVWPSWQARMTLTLTEPSWSGAARQVRQAAFLGDFYLRSHGTDAGSRWRGGFRATSGVVVGHLGTAVLVGSSVTTQSVAADDAGLRDVDIWPYVGVGYTGLAARGGWGVSADFGLALRQPGAAPELGRALLGLRGWEGALRQVDLMPMLQLGVRYLF
jgi:hypothetical protein